MRPINQPDIAADLQIMKQKIKDLEGRRNRDINELADLDDVRVTYDGGYFAPMDGDVLTWSAIDQRWQAGIGGGDSDDITWAGNYKKYGGVTTVEEVWMLPPTPPADPGDPGPSYQPIRASDYGYGAVAEVGQGGVWLVTAAFSASSCTDYSLGGSSWKWPNGAPPGWTGPIDTGSNCNYTEVEHEGGGKTTISNHIMIPGGGYIWVGGGGGYDFEAFVSAHLIHPAPVDFGNCA